MAVGQMASQVRGEVYLMGVRRSGLEQARMDYQEEQERYGLWTSWEEELLLEEELRDRQHERGDLRPWEGF